MSVPFLDEDGVTSADIRCVSFDMRFLGRSHRCGTEKGTPALRLSALTAAVAISMTFGCATPHAILDFTAPSTAIAGSSFTVIVTVMIQGKRDTIINSHIHFTSSDPAAILPPDYTFTPADAGSHTWNDGFTLMTPGNQTVSATIFDATGISGSADVAVSP